MIGTGSTNETNLSLAGEGRVGAGIGHDKRIHQNIVTK